MTQSKVTNSGAYSVITVMIIYSVFYVSDCSFFMDFSLISHKKGPKY
jgi:hypothetical protein